MLWGQPLVFGISTQPGQSCFSFQFCAYLRCTQCMWSSTVATNSYFLTVSELTTTESKNRLRKVIDWLEIPTRTVGRARLQNLQRFRLGVNIKEQQKNKCHSVQFKVWVSSSKSGVYQALDTGWWHCAWISMCLCSFICKMDNWK